MPWLDTRSSARFLDLPEARFLALVRAGTLPAPSFHLGERSPRWSGWRGGNCQIADQETVNG